MKKFIINLIKTLLTCFTAINLIMYFFIRKYPDHFLVNNEDYYVMQAVYKLAGQYPERHNIIIGDSRGNASIIPDSLGKNYLNLSLPGSNLMEGFITVKRRLSISDIDTLLLMYGHNMYENNPWTIRRTIPLKYINAEELSELEAIEQANAQLISERSGRNALSLRYEQWMRKLKYYRLPILYYKDFVNSFNTIGVNNNMEKFDSLVTRNKGQFHFGNKDSSHQVLFLPADHVFKPNPTNLQYLDSLIAYSKRFNFKLLIVVPPVNYSTYSHIGHDPYFKTAETFFSKELGAYTVNKLDYMPDNCFTDSSHLNERGTRIFSQSLSAKLKNR